MTSFWRRGLFRQTWHPSFEELMLFVDEPRSKTDKVETHLKSCWSCRVRREKIDRAISAYMSARNASFAGSRGFPKHALPAFERKLDQLAEESGAPGLFPVFLQEHLQGFLLSRYPLKIAAFVSCLLLVVLVLLRLASAPPVSAKEILDRVRQAEAKELQQSSLPVVYEKLRLRRTSPSQSFGRCHVGDLERHSEQALSP